MISGPITPRTRMGLREFVRQRAQLLECGLTLVQEDLELGASPGGTASVDALARDALGTPLFVESMVADSLLIIAEGTVGLHTKGLKNEDLFLGELTVGDWLGELSLINIGQRLCTANAVTPVTAFEIRQADFQKLIAQKPQACIKLLMSIVSAFGQKVVDNKDALRSLLSK